MSALAHPREPAFAFDAFDDGWSCRREGEAACWVCGRPAWCVDPAGRPRHRVDCLDLVDDARRAPRPSAVARGCRRRREQSP